MRSKEKPYLPQTDPELFRIDNKLVDFAGIIKNHFGETSMVMMYGSAAFKQIGYSQDDINTSKLDCIIAVPDIKRWQKEHSERHPEDFPMIAHLIGSKIRSKLQGQKTWFVLTQLPIKGDKNQRKIKVGVIEESALVQDLSQWGQFYTPGRMQKPSYLAESTPEIEDALYNRTMKQGLYMALLQNTDEKPISARALYVTLSNLSYTGDTRMGFAENKNKVANIVDANLWKFDLMYTKIIGEAQDKGLLTTYSGYIRPVPWQGNHDLLISTVEQLPLNIISTLPQNWRELSHSQIIEIINSKLAKTVKWSSIYQASLGLLTVSLEDGAKYVARKLKKARISK